jgi:hypothetical protein
VATRGRAERASEVGLPEEHDTIQAFLFDGPDESHRVRVTVRRAVGRLDHAHPGGRQRLPNGIERATQCPRFFKAPWILR